MRAKFINEFTRNSNPLDTLGIGYTGKRRKIVESWGLEPNEWTIDSNGTIIINIRIFDICRYRTYYEQSITELLDDMIINGRLDLRGSIIKTIPNKIKVCGDCLTLSGQRNISELPSDLIVINDLNINATSITKFPLTIEVGGNITVNPGQINLINFINNSKFKSHLRIV